MTIRQFLTQDEIGRLAAIKDAHRAHAHPLSDERRQIGFLLDLTSRLTVELHNQVDAYDSAKRTAAIAVAKLAEARSETNRLREARKVAQEARIEELRAQLRGGAPEPCEHGAVFQQCLACQDTDPSWGDPEELKR